ncbi:hypothetical protein D3C80_1844220 [compost metagenome]
MAARERGVLHFSQQACAQIRATQLLIDGHAFDDVCGEARTSHQLRTGPRLHKQADVVVQPQAAVCQQIANLA